MKEVASITASTRTERIPLQKASCSKHPNSKEDLKKRKNLEIAPAVEIAGHKAH